MATVMRLAQAWQQLKGNVRLRMRLAACLYTVWVLEVHGD